MYRHPNSNEASQILMSLRPRLALDAIDEWKAVDDLDNRLYRMVQEGLRIMALPPDFRNDTLRRAYFQRFGKLIKEWESLRDG